MIDSLLSAIQQMHIPGLETAFMRHALLGLLFLGPTCAAMGTLVVEFRMAFFAEAVAHSAFTGVAIGLLAGFDPRLTMLVFGVLVGLGLTRLASDLELSNETITGVLLSTNVALGVALISSHRALGGAITGFLFGDILTIDTPELSGLALLLVAVFGLLALGYNRLLLIGLDPDVARVYGVRVGLWRSLYAALLAVTVVFCIRAVGILLATALVVIPAAAARNLAGQVLSFFWLAILGALASAIAGLALSVRTDTATGAMIILAAAAGFVVSWLFTVLRRR